MVERKKTTKRRTKKRRAVVTADQLLSPSSREIREFELPQLDGVVYLREMTAEEMTIAFETGDETDPGETVRTVARCLCDEGGEPLLTDDEVGKFEAAVGVKTWLALQDAAIELNDLGRFRPDRQISAEQVAEAMKQCGIADDRAAGVLRLLPTGEDEEAAKNA